jgi:hypothetical protein
MRRKPPRQGGRLIEFFKCRVVIFFVFIFVEVGLLDSGDRVKRRYQRRSEPDLFSTPAEDALECRMT